MTLLPPSAGFLEQAQAYFLSFRGDGVALSPLDAELLEEWQRRGVPYPVVCLGVRRAAEARLRDARPGEARLRTLRSCRAIVEREFRRWEGLSTGKGADATPREPGSFAAERLKKARAKVSKALAQAPGEAHRAGLAAALEVLGAECDDPREMSRRAARAEETLALVWARRLPWAERGALVRAARVQAGPRPPGASPRARRDALRAHLVAVARAAGGLVSIS